jgi:UDP:flavonoid glycosyltransferase YjiC (YdhE family)
LHFQEEQMAHWVIGWELGHGMGHIMPLRMLAEALLQRGHRLTFIVRDVAVTQRALNDLPVTWLQAPQVRYQPWELTRTDCYSQLLGNIGFNNPAKLTSTVRGWIDLLTPLKPDVAVLEFAPSAMVACDLLSIPFALQGNGFFCPPAIREDFGIMQSKMPEAARLAEDAALLDSVNQVIRANQGSPLQHISDLYGKSRHTILTTFAELDHFQRPAGPHFSGVWVPQQQKRADWPKGKGKRIFAYLNTRPGVEKVLAMLSRSGMPTLVHCAGLEKKHQQPFISDSCHFLEGLVDLRALAEQADLGVFHGNHSSTALFLLAGTPTLQLPLYMEQLMFARCIKALGAGELVTLDQPDRVAQALDAMTQNPDYATAAKKFATQYSGFDQSVEIEQAAMALEAALQ